MEKIGIICEYNPFHNGHLHHIKMIKKMYPNDIIILILNGYFLQRGEISILNKEAKTKIALQNKVDLVVELPVLYGTQSADNFAYYSIFILNELKIDKLVFGSETNDVNNLKIIANEVEKNKYKNKIKSYLKKGYSYPASLSKALGQNIIYGPNDILGISYIKAINKINNKIEVISIKRTSDYLDTLSDDKIISASNIREKLKNNIDINTYLPKSSLKAIKNIDYDLYFDILKTIIITNNNLHDILDVDEGIEKLLKKEVVKANNIDDFIQRVKTKRYTYNKINRMLVHILLNIKKSDTKLQPNYIKILGFNDKGQKHLNEAKKDINLKLKVIKNDPLYHLELRAAIIYDLLTNDTSYKKELEAKPF